MRHLNNKAILFLPFVVVVGMGLIIVLRSLDRESFLRQSNIPIYPKAKLQTKDTNTPCSRVPTEQYDYIWGAFGCDSTSYVYTSADEFDSVVKWYSDDASQSGWKLEGGAGASGVDRFGDLVKGDTHQHIVIKNTEKGKTTIIILTR